ncbi:hypothetical protein DFR50_11986 [Roseiarcus fermentans]|jgi:hypothetical protein|uniref:Uncharacterized protein n=1 Tax=Roseiarcus fermentans TaxID=1473586 RepID=A0A366F9L4_9HYPH|nr:hypothetical protein [Roseiarcus fermentans]RBP10415.1 hypothetical protein DFR50_11986 [Roseiarcus fermentans]
MKIMLAALVIGPIVLAGTAQAGSTPSNPLRGIASTIHLAAAENPTDRKTYVQTKDAGMAQWRSTIDDFATRTQAKATAADEAASREIQGAWDHVERASSALDVAGEDSWDSAKAAYERSFHDLEATWARVGSSRN